MQKLRFVITVDMEVDLELMGSDTIEEAIKVNQKLIDGGNVSAEDILSFGTIFTIKAIACKKNKR